MLIFSCSSIDPKSWKYSDCSIINQNAVPLPWTWNVLIVSQPLIQYMGIVAASWLVFNWSYSMRNRINLLSDACFSSCPVEKKMNGVCMYWRWCKRRISTSVSGLQITVTAALRYSACIACNVIWYQPPHSVNEVQDILLLMLNRVHYALHLFSAQALHHGTPSDFRANAYLHCIREEYIGIALHNI